MKSWLIGLAFAVLAAPASHAATLWIVGEDDALIVLVDADSVRDDAGQKRASVHVVTTRLAEMMARDPVVVVDSDVEFDCVGNRQREHALTFISEAGEVVAESHAVQDWITNTPGTPAAAVADFVCRTPGGEGRRAPSDDWRTLSHTLLLRMRGTRT